jgi:hypothetical protein
MSEWRRNNFEGLHDAVPIRNDTSGTALGGLNTGDPVLQGNVIGIDLDGTCTPTSTRESDGSADQVMTLGHAAGSLFFPQSKEGVRADVQVERTLRT